jgi:tRNA-uridine 2-sulfurtransferase
VSARKKARVAVAMSGGVDSSVAAALLIEQGYDVFGLTMKLVDLPPEYCRSESLRSCCGSAASNDAWRVALALGIPHYMADMRVPFERLVIDDFRSEYGKGRTPNPCIRCNRFIKFDLLLERAREIGADLIATGHYARVERDGRSGPFLLKKGRDAAKDQSYFLYAMGQKELSRTLLPVGGLEKKSVRRLAATLKLPVADKPESQEICFVPDDDYPRFLRGGNAGVLRPGPIVDQEGRVLGKHRGIAHFTIGQRRGLGIAASRPLYVLSVDAASDTVVVGTEESLAGRGLMASDVTLVSGGQLEASVRARVKIRSRHAEAMATIRPCEGSKVAVEFDSPQRAVAPGQAAVFYRRNTVLGGGTIDSVVR